MNMKEFFTNLIQEGQGNIDTQMAKDNMWIIMQNPIGITQVDSAVFWVFEAAFKWHQFDVTQLLCSLQDIQTWALHKHFAENSDQQIDVNEQPILSAGQSRSMTSRKFRQLFKKHTGAELDWMGVFNAATEMQWWTLFMLRSIVGTVTVNDKLGKTFPDTMLPDELVAKANGGMSQLDKALAAKLAAELAQHDRDEEEE